MTGRQLQISDDSQVVTGRLERIGRQAGEDMQKQAETVTEWRNQAGCDRQAETVRLLQTDNQNKHHSCLSSTHVDMFLGYCPIML